MAKYFIAAHIPGHAHPRMPGKIAHKLHDIFVITVLAVISGMEHWTQIEGFAKPDMTETIC